MGKTITIKKQILIDKIDKEKIKKAIDKFLDVSNAVRVEITPDGIIIEEVYIMD